MHKSVFFCENLLFESSDENECYKGINIQTENIWDTDESFVYLVHKKMTACFTLVKNITNLKNKIKTKGTKKCPGLTNVHKLKNSQNLLRL